MTPFVVVRSCSAYVRHKAVRQYWRGSFWFYLGMRSLGWLLSVFIDSVMHIKCFFQQLTAPNAELLHFDHCAYLHKSLKVL